MRHFILSIFVAIASLILSFVWAGAHGVIIFLLMIAMEISFSVDNAVVNAAILRGMSPLWQKRFLTWGMLIATFGMYYLFPILIVSVATGINMLEVTRIALNDPATYSRHLAQSHTQISAFGGMFLLMVFLTFIMDESKDRHWFTFLEKRLTLWGKLEAVEIILSLAGLLVIQSFLPQEEKLHAMVAGTFGVVLYVAINSVTTIFGIEDMRKTNGATSGLMGFLYLNLLDASFSLDAVAGSFAISSDIVIIVLGLSTGAMFVRSITLHMVRSGTLDKYVFLEHGAHYAIGALASIMLVSLITPVSEVITGLIGLVFIGAALFSSVRYNKSRPNQQRTQSP